MGIEAFAARHPIGYVHIAYAVVWILQFGYGAWVVRALRSLRRGSRQG